ncbi:class A beta-lactamase [Pseudonocardia sp. NPDC046786]|uniref:class A beta-lactamase n=1 Tax=Pseudonocardia sp. NPDC046786 TaxID=3155471 RepID=UPI00340D4A29
MTLSRRSLLAAGLGTALAGGIVSCTAAPPAPAPTGPVPGLPDLEREFGRRIGVHALDIGTGAAVGHRDGERFLMCSVVKALTAAFVLHRSVQEPGLLARPVRWDRADLLEYAPVTERHLATGLTVEQLCDAAVTVSDNTAQNLLLRQVGPPAELTGWLRGLGDDVTRADRTETALNERDGDLDTSTPAALAATLRVLTTGDALPGAQRDRLLGWLRANTTGDRQIRAGVPAGWQVGDKTGSGPLGERNDSGVLFPPQGAPVVLTVFTVPDDPDEDPDRGEAAVAAATRTTLAALRG